MKTLLALLLLCSVAAADDAWVITDTSAPESAAVSVDSYVYPVRVRGRNNRGQSVVDEGCGVSIGEGRLQTVAHLWTGVSSPVTEVQVDGKWQRASYRIVDASAAGDVAFVRISATLPAAPRREPQYMERVTVYGLGSKALQCGVASGPGMVSLDANEQGTVQGDSGGGVFSEDGEFLGTVRGSQLAENRVVSFKANDFPVVLVAAAKPKAAGDKYDAIIRQWYRGGAYWTHMYEGTGRIIEITKHLREDHDIPDADLRGMSNAKKEKLHSALHEREIAPRRQNVVQRLATPDCPDGNCPLQRPQYGNVSPRSP